MRDRVAIIQRRIGWLVLPGLVVLAASGCDALQDAPPTVTPIYITATPEPPIVPIVATETPAATPVVAATSAVALPTQAAGRTATPSPAPPITMTPSFTPTMTDTPITPGAVGFAPVGGDVGLAASGGASGGACTTAISGTFGTIYQSDPGLQSALGCPQASGASDVSSAYQTFQNGVMIWISSLGTQPQAAIYALYNNGTYQRFNDTFTEGIDPDSSGAQPPPGLQEPVRGFGKVWRENPAVRETLGWATSGESGGTARVLMFERGEMLSVAQANQTYIMISGAPGTWTARSGS